MLKKIIIIFSVLFLSNIALANLSKLNSISEGLVTALAIHLDHSTKSNLQSLLNGDTVLLLLNLRQDYVMPEAKDLVYFADLNDLATLEAHYDGRIDAHDALMGKLFLLVFYNNGQKYKLVSIQQSGIRSLFLTQHHLQQYQEHNESKQFQQIAEHAVMADGSIRSVFPFTFNAEYLKVIQNSL